MTIDKQKLKALAEAATQSHGARRVEVDHNGVHVIGDGSWKILSAWHTPDGKGAQNAEFAAAASPATVLALLAEIDQLKAENEALREDAERYRFVRSPIGTSSPLAIWNEEKMPLFSSIADAVVDEFMAKEATNKGHGHVFARHDGVKARCGGPGMCAECRAEQQAKEASHD